MVIITKSLQSQLQQWRNQIENQQKHQQNGGPEVPILNSAMQTNSMQRHKQNKQYHNLN